ncbi:BnaC05g40580D [Brassica napus]|uniref:BnaC05g40580D protein n=1 Tax=Brassica napus TaxID=3708 RepID=A0A078HWP7_BRANA|nr:BnaC05g40580D [Brassica napus]
MVEYVYDGECCGYLAEHWSCKCFFLIQGTGVGLRRNFGGGLARTLLVEFSRIVSMEAVLNFAGVVEIEFTGAVELGSYILYPVNNVCGGLLVR